MTTLRDRAAAAYRTKAIEDEKYREYLQDQETTSFIKILADWDIKAPDHFRGTELPHDGLRLALATNWDNDGPGMGVVIKCPHCGTETITDTPDLALMGALLNGLWEEDCFECGKSYPARPV